MPVTQSADVGRIGRQGRGLEGAKMELESANVELKGRSSRQRRAVLAALRCGKDPEQVGLVPGGFEPPGRNAHLGGLLAF